MKPLNGVLPVDKPSGPTSHDIVARARRALGVRRIGHSGTLDPFASGLLLLCIGPTTRLAEYLTGLPKSYSATLILGVSTDTDDREGAVLSTSAAWVDVTQDRLQAALAEQTGDILQIPPRFSAKKVDGERMYAMARRGDAFTPAPVPVTIDSIRLTRFEGQEADVEIDCSSGTYIRAIARDVGVSLGVGAHLSRLRRTAIDGYDVADAIQADSLDDPGLVEAAWIAPVDAVREMARVVIDAQEKAAILNGRPVSAGTVAEGQQASVRAALPAGTPIAMVTPEGELLAVGARRADLLYPRKVFAG
jgi:tRNA pseudouridine55 synthase